MDKNFQKILECFGGCETHEQCGTCRGCHSEIFLRKYWLSEEEWQSYWLPLENSIFCPDATRLPDMMFQEGFVFIVAMKGVPFVEFDFHALQNCMKEAGDKEFVMIENYRAPLLDRQRSYPDLRFKFPVDITWDKINNGKVYPFDLASELLDGRNEFFIFGDSGSWGKYAACEYMEHSFYPCTTPLDIIGFKPELTSIFKQHFCCDDQMFFYAPDWSKEEREEGQAWLLDCLPPSYKKRMGLPLDSNRVVREIIDPPIVVAFDPIKAVATQITSDGQEYVQTLKIKQNDGQEIDILTVWTKNHEGIANLVNAVHQPRQDEDQICIDN
jgi:hypothetical protein